MSRERLSPGEHAALRVHGRKHSHRLSIEGRHLWEHLLPQLRAPLDVTAANPEGLFPFRPRDICLEIGFGDGGHLAWRAGANPQTGFIGCEPYVNGVARLLQTIAAMGLGNIRIHPGDARVLLAALPDASLERIYILFPDPWPRKRHHKRRFMSPENIAALARVLRRGGLLCFATDSVEYCQSTLALMQTFPEFAPSTFETDSAPVTKYEAKARAAGRRPEFHQFIRIQTNSI